MSEEEPSAGVVVSDQTLKEDAWARYELLEESPQNKRT